MNALDATRQAELTETSEPPTKEYTGRSSVLRSTKIHDFHLDRLAIEYVRQSCPHQVLNNRESRERQYARVDHAVSLGWRRYFVLIIDEDQGQCGKTAEHRGGFHRLRAEVTMDHVGLVLAIEMSRLASSKTINIRISKSYHFFEPTFLRSAASTTLTIPTTGSCPDRGTNHQPWAYCDEKST